MTVAREHHYTVRSRPSVRNTLSVSAAVGGNLGGIALQCAVVPGRRHHMVLTLLVVGRLQFGFCLNFFGKNLILVWNTEKILVLTFQHEYPFPTE